MELKNNGKINFIIDLFLPLDKYMSGGLVALHKLAYNLADSGHNVYIFCEPAYPHRNITVIPAKYEIITGHRFNCSWEGFSFNYNNTVSIYPEHSGPNKFNTSNNVRWIMYHTTKKEEESFNDTDYIFNYGNFKTYTNREDGKLRVLDYNLEVFYDKKELRSGYCHILGKETPKNYKEIIANFNSTDITHIKDQTDLNLLREEFNKYEYFLTFDKKTYLTTAATLCGCKSVILNNGYNNNYLTYINGEVNNAYTDLGQSDKELTPLEYRLENPIKMFGVAYGLEDLPWAEKTVTMVRDYVKELEKIDKKNVNKFINFWEKKCYG